VPETTNKLVTFLKARLGILGARYTRHQAKRRLRLRDTLSLGDKRFLAVVEYRQQEILIAGTPGSITVLANSSLSDARMAANDERINLDSLQ